MRFYTKQHKYYCGIDLHTKMMYVCILDVDGKIYVHRNIKTHPDAFLKLISPYREDLVVAVECMFSWYWIADLCVQEDICFVLGHALYMKAIHGGKAKNDKVDSRKIATLLRGGNIPYGYAYPRKMRATRDLMRRRNKFVQQRAKLMAHIQNTRFQYNLPEPLGRIAHPNKRAGIAARFDQESVKRSVAADLEMIFAYDKTIAKLEYDITKTAKQHDPVSYALLQSVPGIGDILGLILLYEIEDINRFPSVQDFASYCRLVKCAKESAGKKFGTSGAKIGNAHLRWAFGEAAIIFMRSSDPAKRYVEKLTKKHGKGKALSIFSHKIGRAVYYMLKNKEAFNIEKFFTR